MNTLHCVLQFGALQNVCKSESCTMIGKRMGSAEARFGVLDKANDFVHMFVIMRLIMILSWLDLARCLCGCACAASGETATLREQALLNLAAWDSLVVAAETGFLTADGGHLLMLVCPLARSHRGIAQHDAS